MAKKLKGHPGNKPNDFVKVNFLTDELIYDPSYIHKHKFPTLSQIISKINELVIAVADLQQVVTDLVNNDLPETRDVMNDVVWDKVKDCCDALLIGYTPNDLISGAFNQKGVVEEGIDPYTCHVTVD